MFLIVPSLLDVVTILLTTNRNIKGDIGKPCLRPIVAKKKLVVEPFINNANNAEERHPII